MKTRNKPWRLSRNQPAGFNKRIRNLHVLEKRHRQAEQALQESEELYRAVVENVADGIAITLGTERVFVNPAFLKIHGLSSRDSVLGQPLDQYILPEDRETVKNRSIARQKGEKVREINEYRIRRPDGTIKTVQSSAVKINYQGRPANLAVLRDITEFKEAETQIRKLNTTLSETVEELTRSNQQLDSFNYTVSHDLRTPLMVIRGFGRRLLKDHGRALNRKVFDYLNIINQNAAKMEQLIDNLLAYSRLGRQELKSDLVDMEYLAASIVDELHIAFHEGKKSVRVSSLPKAMGDATMLRHVWVNLLSNAFKFTSTRPVGVIDVSGREDDAHQVVYQVSDNGVGFNMSDYDRLFEVFQRLNQSDEFPGTGIGLAIVSMIIQRHGGRVWAEGRVNKGATFYFSLPKAK